MSKYNCIILDPDMPSRMKLKQATTQVSDFGKVTPVGTINDANSILGSGEGNMDIIFVSTRFDNEVITNFINQAKACKAGQDTAYVMIVKSQSSSVAQNMLLGGDSVLCEPYSVDSMLEITRLAAIVKKERADAREKIAINLLIGDISNQIDLIACLKASGCEPGTSIKKFRDVCASLTKLSPETKEYYYETLINKLIDAKVPPKALAAKKYSGVSSRVKKRMETKLIAAIDKTEKPAT
jgi:hypothetical protein